MAGPMRLFSTLTHVLLLCYFIQLAGCDRSGTGPSNLDDSVFTISGKVSSWNMGDTLKAVAGSFRTIVHPGDTLAVFGAGPIYGDGNFHISLSAPPSNMLYSFRYGDQIRVSDTSAKRLVVGFLNVRRPDGTYLGTGLDNANKPFPNNDVPGDFYASFWYVDKDVSVIGSAAVSPGLDRDSTYMLYDIHCKRGWNRILNTIVAKDVNTTTHQISVDNNNSGNWFLE